jgi:glycosyltransferase involved in cell wall biosynthesis
MRICVDATSLLLRSAGVKNYVYHWMRSLKAECPEDEITAFPMLGEAGDLDHERSLLTLRQTIPRIALLHLCNIRHSPVIDYAVRGADVFHASNLLRNLPRRMKLTGTIYDMTALLMPEVHTPGNIQAERSFHDRVLKKADGLIAISESARNDAVRLLSLKPERISVIYPGVDQRFFEAAPMRREKPYVLFLGTLEPRKNLDVLLDAWLELPRDTREAHDLVIAGPVGWASDRMLARIRSGIAGVEYVGYVPERELPALTAGASVFVYPSLYEGFGFPLAQAMAAGVPCVTSNVSSMPEVAGSTALLVDPKDSFGMRDAIARLLGSETMRKDLGTKAKQRAREFTWKNSAERSAEFFRCVCG